LNKQELIDFEEEVFRRYEAGEIKFPIHLRSGYEDILIDVFNNFYRDGDYVFGYWAQHLHALLAGVPKQKLMDKILRGHSISLMMPEHRFYCSGIVGSLCGTAVGTAWQLKQEGSKNRVLHFCGDMSSFLGIFREAVEYAVNFDLPVLFFVESNGVSVTTNTKEVWGNPTSNWWENTRYTEKIIYYEFESKYPHSGIGKRVAF